MHPHEKTSPLMNEKDKRRGERPFSKLRWSLIAIFVVFVVLLYSVPSLFGIQFIVFVALLFVIAILHGVERYGARNTAVFLFIVLAVSLFFESMSIRGAFAPFIFYHYDMPLVIPGLGVPLTVIFAFFAAGYFSWMLSHVLTGQYSTKLKGKWILVVPFIAALIMVMWDLGMDPIFSTVLKQWVWQTTGPYYFGVPIPNFCGWFNLVFISYLLFALFLSKYDRIQPQKMNTLRGKPYWIEAAVVYGLIGLSIIVASIFDTNDITLSIAFVTIFTMIFVAIISLIAIINNNELR
jgi:uncharacterized membrane protein